MAAEDGLKAQKLLSQGSALGNVGKNKAALKGQKLSISKLLPFQGDFGGTNINLCLGIDVSKSKQEELEI